MARIIYIPFDHLHRKFGALKDADPKTDVIAWVSTFEEFTADITITKAS